MGHFVAMASCIIEISIKLSIFHTLCNLFQKEKFYLHFSKFLTQKLKKTETPQNKENTFSKIIRPTKIT
jgi:hypothetical protein